MSYRLSKNERTLDAYKKVGSEMRLLYSLAINTLTDLSSVMYDKDYSKTKKILSLLSELRCDAEEYMLEDFPSLPDDLGDGTEFSVVFYGGMSQEPRNELDAEIIQKAREIASNLFSRERAVERF